MQVSSTRRRHSGGAIAPGDVKAAFEIFGSELAEDAFCGALDRPRPRDIHLTA
jgi:hypothetical protein